MIAGGQWPWHARICVQGGWCGVGWKGGRAVSEVCVLLGSVAVVDARQAVQIKMIGMVQAPTPCLTPTLPNTHACTTSTGRDCC